MTITVPPQRVARIPITVICQVEGDASDERIAKALALLLPLPQFSVGGTVVTPTAMQVEQ